nr:gliding motility-associated C-terminal domain-containing protein [Bacteroidales bacterium]
MPFYKNIYLQLCIPPITYKCLKSGVFILITLLIHINITAQVLINEVMVNPSGNQGLTQTGKEYIELFNTNPCSSIDISGYILASRSKLIIPGGENNYGGAFIFPKGTLLQPLGFIVIGTENSTPDPGSIDIKLPAYTGQPELCEEMPNLWSLPNIEGWLALYDEKGLPVDAIYWDSNSSEINTDADAHSIQPCVPSTAAGTGISELYSAKQIYQNYKSKIAYTGSATDINKTFSRMPDGGTWQKNIDPSINDANRNALSQPLNFNDLNNLPSLTNLFNWKITINLPACNANDGSININITNGGSAPFSYSINEGVVFQASGNFNNLYPGKYSVIVKDNKGCERDTLISLLPANSPVINQIITTPSNCNKATGSAEVFADNGNPPYTYLWSSTPQQTTKQALNLPPGNYIVTVYDNNNCLSISYVTINNIPGPTITLITIPDTCAQNKGSAIVYPSGGTAPFTYKWNSSPVQTTQIAQNLKSDSYSVTVTDNKGCSTTANFELIDVGGPTVNINSKNPTCNNNNGSINVDVNGGKSPYNYIWDSGQTGSMLSNLPPGSYSITVTDQSGCPPFKDEITLTNVPPPIINSIIPEDASCGNNNGKVSINISGGIPPYKYLWNNSETSQNIENLNAGTYSVTVTDQTPCTATESVVVNNIGGPTLNIGKTDEKCDNKEGMAFVTANGGSGFYTYLWNTVPALTTDTIKNLSAGTYSVTVSDGGPCEAVISVEVLNTPGFNVELFKTDAHCQQSDGSISTVLSGASGNISYLWNTNPAQNTDKITGVPPGSYTVTITDDKCTVTASTTIINLEGPKAEFSFSPSFLYFSNPVCQFVDNSDSSVISWTWNFGDGSALSYEKNPSHKFTTTDTFYIKLVVKDAYNCSDSITKFLWVKEDFRVFIPTAFSPNDDYINDYLLIKGTSIDTKDFDLKIFNRWGNEVFKTNNISEGWDGRFNSIPVPQD